MTQTERDYMVTDALQVCDNGAKASTQTKSTCSILSLRGLLRSADYLQLAAY